MDEDEDSVNFSFSETTRDAFIQSTDTLAINGNVQDLFDDYSDASSETIDQSSVSQHCITNNNNSYERSVLSGPDMNSQSSTNFRLDTEINGYSEQSSSTHHTSELQWDETSIFSEGSSSATDENPIFQLVEFKENSVYSDESELSAPNVNTQYITDTPSISSFSAEGVRTIYGQSDGNDPTATSSSAVSLAVNTIALGEDEVEGNKKKTLRFILKSMKTVFHVGYMPLIIYLGYKSAKAEGTPFSLLDLLPWFKN
ncbi:uncharacterized protein LOC119690143 [Teleopsis dalmanni]|uniref:uncharacterized protein LOC119690143 n=1 Tax=Teleopsis dalmanni TaxID=139649 RepID=UPI0018CCF0FA|nr:uncharacterized protein LOC119690143 [Teleopsis dalmanni]